MSSVKLKFRANADNTHEGTLFFQIIHNREVKQITTVIISMRRNGTNGVRILF